MDHDHIKDTDQRTRLIKKQPCFSKLSEKELNELSDLFVVTVFNQGEVIVKEGDNVDKIYLIVKGQCEVRHEYIDNDVLKYTPLAVLAEGEAIGLNEAGFYSLSGVRTATVIAMTDMVVLELSVARFHGFALLYPHVKQEMNNYATAILNIKV